MRKIRRDYSRAGETLSSIDIPPQRDRDKVTKGANAGR